MSAFRREKKKEDMKNESWSDLPDDLIVSIMECLYAADRVRFRAVCKRWSVQSPHLVKLPWTMEYKWRNLELLYNSSSFCRLYEPLHHNNRNLPYIVENGRIKGRRSFWNAKVYASLDGWILLEKHHSVGRLFFFNPFTTKVIYLPTLDTDGFEFAAFSSGPDSPACFVFAVEERFNGHYLQMYSHANKIWKTCRIIKEGHNLGMLTGVSYVEVEGEGTVYCCFSSFHLVKISVNESPQKPPNLVVTAAYPVLDYPFLTDICSCYHLLACDGDLFFVYLLESSFCHKLSVLKLDMVRREWVQVSSLGGRAFFLGNTSFCVSAGPETEIIANRVYYFYKGAAHFQTLDGDIGNDSPDEEVENAEIYGCSWNGQNIIWIQPPKHL